MSRAGLGRSGVELSTITFGTMRLVEGGHDDHHWRRLLQRAIDLGVTTFHSSSEYPSFDRFCSLLSGLRTRTAEHIVKLADPHFGEERFDPDRLSTRIDAYLTALGVDHLDVVQWMWRDHPEHEERRRAGLARQRDEIVATFAALVESGKIGAVATFPYSTGFADDLLAGGVGDGLTVYVNPLEREFEDHLPRAASAGWGTVALRPFAAGDAFDRGWTPAQCIEYALTQPSVATTVVSVSSDDHLSQLEQLAAAPAPPRPDSPGA